MPWRMTRMPRPSVPWSVPRLRWPIILTPCSYFRYDRIASPRHSGPDDAVHPTSLHTHPCPRRWFHLQSPLDLVPAPKTPPLATGLPLAHRLLKGIHAQSLRTNFVICPKTPCC